MTFPKSIINDENIIYISQFGSYGTSQWKENFSDIDIGVIVKSLDDLDFTLEDTLKDLFIKEYNYSDIQITIVILDLNQRLVRNIICGKTLFSKLDEKSLKYESLYIEKNWGYYIDYYEIKKLEKLKHEVSELW